MAWELRAVGLDHAWIDAAAAAVATQRAGLGQQLNEAELSQSRPPWGERPRIEAVGGE